MKRLSYKKQIRNGKSIKDAQAGAILCILIVGLALYYIFLSPNVAPNNGKVYLHLQNAVSAKDMFVLLKEKNILKDPISFRSLMFFYSKANFNKGLYVLDNSWGNWKVMHALQTGTLTSYHACHLPALRSRKLLVGIVSKATGIQEAQLLTSLQDSNALKNLGGGFTPENIYCIFLPGTYYLPMTATPTMVLESMYSNYALFWTNQRERAAVKNGLTTEQATILASIVYAETKNKAEMPKVAGLYLNRLKQKMKLEADPTLLYSLGKWDAKRVYRKYASHPSRYNTYRYRGLPPGPIGPTTPDAIEAVLHPSEHSYLFFCARGDASGCHVFSKNFKEHVQQATRYRKLLDKKGVK